MANLNKKRWRFPTWARQTIPIELISASPAFWTRRSLMAKTKHRDIMFEETKVHIGGSREGQGFGLVGNSDVEPGINE